MGNITEVTSKTCKRRVSLLLIFSQLLVGAPVWAKTNEPPEVIPVTEVPLPETASASLTGPENVPVSQETTIYLSEEDLKEPLNWKSHEAAVLPEAFQVFRETERVAAHLKETLSPEEFEIRLEKDDITANVPGLGRAELNIIDGVHFVRVVHERSKLSLLFLDESKISPKSKHLAQFIARQHLDAGDMRPNGSKPGRDTVLVWMKDGEVSRTQYRPRHFPMTPGWWADQWRATVKGANKGDYMFGTFCAALQTGSSACVSGIKTVLEPGTSFDAIPLGLTALFAMVLGTWNSTYRNWTYRGSDFSKLLKLSSVSLLFAYSLAIMQKGSAQVFNVVFLDPVSLGITAHIITNTVMHNLGRKAWQQLPEIRNSMRANTGNLFLPMFGKRVDTGISLASFENQMIYLVPFTLKLMGLVGLGVGITIPGIGVHIDSGTLMLLASVPLARWLVVKYAEKVHYAHANLIRESWEKFKALPMALPRAVFGLAGRSLRWLGQTVAATCGGIISSILPAPTPRKDRWKREDFVPQPEFIDFYDHYD